MKLNNKLAKIQEALIIFVLSYLAAEAGKEMKRCGSKRMKGIQASGLIQSVILIRSVIMGSCNFPWIQSN